MPGPTMDNTDERNVFVTVGTTRFDKLVASVTSTVALEWMASRGFKRLTIQYGKGQKPEIEVTATPMAIRAYDFLPSLAVDMKRADLIISHAGAGTVMEGLRLGKNLVVVINTQLMDNHQVELAEAMAKRGHLLMVDQPEDLDTAETWKSFEKFSRTPHIDGDENDFPRLLDAHLGFQSSKKD